MCCIFYSYLNTKLLRLSLLVISIFITYSGITCSKTPTRKPLRVVIDLNIGESRKVKLNNGEIANVKLLDIIETRDEVCSAVRSVQVKVAVNGEEITLNSANYNLPVTAADVQIDCPITKGYYTNTNQESWGLEKDARLRLWSGGSPFIEPELFCYPVKQRWLANDTQMANEPTFVDWGEDPLRKKIYYHDGLDFGGAEGAVEVVSATDGLVVSSKNETLKEHEKNTPVSPRYDAVYILDDRGWYYRYSHLYSIDPAIRPGVKVKMGQKLGLLGKEGASGGWTHLHFCIKCRQPSGKWGTEEGYAYIWQSYVRQYNPPLIAVARPHHLAFTGQTVTLDGRKSKSFAGEIIKYEWFFSDGSKASGPVQERKYNLPGTYSEALKIVDSKGNIDYDYTVVQVRDKKNLNRMPPSIHATFYPTLNIKPGDPVTFGVRTFQTEYGNEVWDFGDGSPKVTVKSIIPKHPDGTKGAYTTKGYDFRKGDYAKTVHKYSKAGHYLVRVERADENGYKAMAHLHVEVLD